MLPGGPWIQATSGDSNANLTAAFWLALSVGSKKTRFSRGFFSEGAEIPSNTSVSFVMGGVYLAPSCRSIQWENATKQRGGPNIRHPRRGQDYALELVESLVHPASKQPQFV